MLHPFLLIAASLLAPASLAQAPSDNGDGQPIRLPRHAKISPGGDRVVFNWQDDLWVASSEGGEARRLTVHPGRDEAPVWNPDGKEVVFRSDRSGTWHLYAMSLGGGAAQQISVATTADAPIGFSADGTKLIVLRRTDRGYHRSEVNRVFEVDRAGQAPDRMLLDIGVVDAALSPDGKRLLFNRGRSSWSRKGYKGAAALQLWVADLTTAEPALTRLDKDMEHFQNVTWKNPIWAPDGKSAYYISDPDGTFDVYRYSFESGESERLTELGAEDKSDDGAMYASLSSSGQVMLFRRRFDLQRLNLQSGEVSEVPLWTSADASVLALERRIEDSVTGAAFTKDGKQMAFVAGNDVYVMDRILKEPVRVTHTPQREANLVFSADDSRLFFTSDAGGEIDIWEATHEQSDGVWWEAKSFTLRQVTDDAPAEDDLALSPKGNHIAFVKGKNIHVMDDDGSDHRRVVDAWDHPTFDWSPDGRWLVYATDDDDYNPDIWITRIDQTREPYNISRHPDWDSSPTWSPDGTRIAFVSRRDGEEADIYYLNLQKQEEEQTERDRKLEEARKAMAKDDKKAKGKKGKPGAKPSGDEKGDGSSAAEETKSGAAKSGAAKSGQRDKAAAGEKGKKSETDNPEIKIDFDGLHDRLHRISIPDSFERSLLWSPDGKKLAFSATIDGKNEYFTVEFPKVEKPKKLASSPLRSATWLPGGKEIVGISGGVPAAMDTKGKTTKFSFRVRAIRDWRVLRQVAFDQAWRAMRDNFYDPRMNHRDWDRIRAKYRPVASQCLGAMQFSHLMNMMLGELNASHMGHSGSTDPLPKPERRDRWQPTTYHLGLRFVQDSEGPGVLVESVIPGSPCDRERSQVLAGERISAIDGVAVNNSTEVARAMTLDERRDVELTVVSTTNEARQVVVRPVTSVASLLYDEYAEGNRALVEKLSDGKLGYLHIRGMNMPSFRQMEEDLYHAGHGKDGLIIDVRFNGGGFTTDHVLTALTQPVHAITRARGSGEGYPQDRKIYASWSKPIVMLCNEHSFSNAEIISHAVQQIGRGPVVGMRTAGGVISTGSRSLLDGSRVRMPFRGWYLKRDGKDMELNGCLPDVPLWNVPGGADAQLEKAVQVLAEGVKVEQAKPKVKLEPAADLRVK